MGPCSAYANHTFSLEDDTIVDTGLSSNFHLSLCRDRDDGQHSYFIIQFWQNSPIAFGKRKLQKWERVTLQPIGNKDCE
jgi:hypothetical protein